MGLQQLTGQTVPMFGRNADVFAWPIYILQYNGPGVPGTPVGPGGASFTTVISGTTATGNTTSTTSNLTTGGPTTISAGAISIEFLLSSDFQGTINGATVNNTGTIVLGVFRLDAPPWKPLAALTYTITAGTA